MIGHGHLALAGEGDGCLGTVGSKDGDGVGVVFEPDTGCGHVVGDDQIE